MRSISRIVWLNNIKTKNIKSNIVKTDNIFSFGKFMKDYPNATKEERQKALKKFLDSTR